MPIQFTDEIVVRYLDMAKLDKSGSSVECRERLATYIEKEYGDSVEGWEIRTGRPWNNMTKIEAEELVHKEPSIMYNPGVLTRLYS